MTALCRATQSGALRSNMPCTAFVVVHGAVRLSFHDMGVWVRFLTSPVVLKEGRPANSADGTWFFGGTNAGSKQYLVFLVQFLAQRLALMGNASIRTRPPPHAGGTELNA